MQAKGSFENTDVIDSEKLVLLRHAPRAGIAPGGGVVLAVDGCVYGTAVTNRLDGKAVPCPRRKTSVRLPQRRI